MVPFGVEINWKRTWFMRSAFGETGLKNWHQSGIHVINHRDWINWLVYEMVPALISGLQESLPFRCVVFPSSTALKSLVIGAAGNGRLGALVIWNLSNGAHHRDVGGWVCVCVFSYPITPCSCQQASLSTDIVSAGHTPR